MASAGPGRSLRVLEREGFFDDAFFKEAWDDFDHAVQSVLDRFDTTGLKSFHPFRPHRTLRPIPIRTLTTPSPVQVLRRSLPRQVDVGSRNHCRDVYTKIRSSKIDEDLYASQALQITEKDGKFQVVMDVKDFNPRELQVRAVDDRIVVEGSYEKTLETGASCKSFYKEFTLPPAADIDHVSTALSKDGVLTIRAPKKDGAAITDAPRTANTSSTSSSTMQQCFSDNNSTTSIKSTSSRKVIHSSSSFESSSTDGFDALPKEMREKLMFCDSGFGSTKTSTCSSPAPSEAGSESSRVSSTMEFDLSKRAPVKTEVAFNVSKASQGPQTQQVPPQQAQPPQSPPNFPQQVPPQQMPQQMPPHMYQQMPPQFQQMPPQFQQMPQQFQQFQQPQCQQSPQPQYQSPPPQFQQSPPPQFPQSPPPQHQYQSPPPQPQYQSPPPQPQYQSPPPQPQFQPQFQPQYQPPQQYNQCTPQPVSKPATGTGNQTSISLTEENGRRVLTSQTSNVVQEKDGFREHKETTAEITDKDSQAARREATTKLSKVEEDPEGKFKRAESTDAEEVSESCIQQLPDGSVMSVKKNSTSSSSVKQSFSTGMTGDMGGFFPPPAFPQGFDDFRGLMGRGPSLMSQMSTDSMGSTLSGRSGFSDMSNFSQFTDSSSPFSEMSNFSNMSTFSSRSKNFQQQPMPQQQQMPQHPQQQPGMMPHDFGGPRMKSFSSSSSSSTFNQSFSSNFGDGNF